jgi:hypothetical protein
MLSFRESRNRIGGLRVEETGLIRVLSWQGDVYLCNTLSVQGRDSKEGHGRDLGRLIAKAWRRWPSGGSVILG